VGGFSPSEMALPNHPDVAYEFVGTLKDCGYRWVLVQEHTVEEPDGGGVRHAHLPNRTGVHEFARREREHRRTDQDARAATPSWSLRCSRTTRRAGSGDLGGRSVPLLVTEIADGENGGVMMDEFPSKYFEVVREVLGLGDRSPERD
jgi:hypothetical protein